MYMMSRRVKIQQWQDNKKNLDAIKSSRCRWKVQNVIMVNETTGASMENERVIARSVEGQEFVSMGK